MRNQKRNQKQIEEQTENTFNLCELSSLLLLQHKKSQHDVVEKTLNLSQALQEYLNFLDLSYLTEDKSKLIQLFQNTFLR